MLLTSEQMEAARFSEAENGESPEFTAGRFFARFPDQYAQIVALRLEGLSIKRLSKMYGCSRNTISAIERREGLSQSVEQIRTRTAAECRRIAGLARERIEECLLEGNVSAKDCGIIMGILEDKAASLSGETPTGAVLVPVPPSTAACVEFLARLQQAASATHLNAPTGAAKEPIRVDDEILVGPPRGLAPASEGPRSGLDQSSTTPETVLEDIGQVSHPVSPVAPQDEVPQ